MNEEAHPANPLRRLVRPAWAEQEPTWADAKPSANAVILNGDSFLAVRRTREPAAGG